jgi:hypothetical protein
MTTALFLKKTYNEVTVSDNSYKRTFQILICHTKFNNKNTQILVIRKKALTTHNIFPPFHSI